MASSFRQRLATGAVWMVLAKLAERSLGLVSTVILVRALVPADFGLIAMATSVMALLELVAAFGFESALIRQPNADRDHYDTAWTLNILLGAVLALLTALLAYPAALFYQEPRLVEIMYVYAACALLLGFENIGVVAFRKEMDFRREFMYVTAKKLTGFCTAVPLALILGNYWALALGALASRVVGNIVSYAMHPYRPRLSLKRFSELFGFSKWLVVHNLGLFVQQRYGDFVLGRMVAANTLGLYSVGKELALLPATELAAPINRALYPGYSKLAHDPQAMRREYLFAIGMIALVSLPASLGVACTAPLIVPVLLGPKWLDAIPVLSILAWSGALSVLQSSAFPVYMAINKPVLAARVGMLHAAIVVVALPLAALNWGFYGALYAMVAISAVMFPITFFFLLRGIGARLRHLVAAIWRPTIAGLVMYVTVSQAVAAQPAAVPDLLYLILMAIVGAVVYALAVLALWWMSGRPMGPEASVVGRLKTEWTKVSARTA